MTATIAKWDPALLGPNGEQTAALADRLSRIKWFSSLGDRSFLPQAEERIDEICKAFQCQQIRWLMLDEEESRIQQYDITQSPLWGALFDIPEQIRSAAADCGRLELQVFAMDQFPESVFHAAYDGAFKALHPIGNDAVKNAVAAALYVSGLAVGWELVSDRLGPNPFLPFIGLFELGLWPLGLFEGEFHIL